jgi:hypothetical protein
VSCPADAWGPDAAEKLQQREFDHAGVKREREGKPIGWVETKKIGAKSVGEFSRPFTADELVSDTTSLSKILQLLKTQSWTFVLTGSEVGGIITRADLNKPPVRIYLFSIISLLEMHLNFWIKKEHSDNGWSQILARERLKSAKKLQEERRKFHEELPLVECLQFCDRRDIVLKNTGLRDKLELGGKKNAENKLRQAEKLRNGLAHSQQDLVEGSSWGDLVSTIDYIQSIVEKSDAAVEELARNSARNTSSDFWELF